MSGPAPAIPRPEPAPAALDLSEEIILSVDKQPNDRVTCRRIFGDHYRCNWWAPATLACYDNPGMAGLTVTTHRVRQSRFLTATRTAAGLVLADVQDRRPR
jgi:hypothetical protein